MQMPKGTQHCLRILGSTWKVQVDRLESPLTKCAAKEKDMVMENRRGMALHVTTEGEEKSR